MKFIYTIFFIRISISEWNKYCACAIRQKEWLTLPGSGNHLVGLRHQAISWTNVDKSPKRSCGTLELYPKKTSQVKTYCDSLVVCKSNRNTYIIPYTVMKSRYIHVKIHCEISRYFWVNRLPHSMRNYKEEAEIKPSENALAMPGQYLNLYHMFTPQRFKTTLTTQHIFRYIQMEIGAFIISFMNATNGASVWRLHNGPIVSVWYIVT